MLDIHPISYARKWIGGSYKRKVLEAYLTDSIQHDCKVGFIGFLKHYNNIGVAGEVL